MKTRTYLLALVSVGLLLLSACGGASFKSMRSVPVEIGADEEENIEIAREIIENEAASVRAHLAEQFPDISAAQIDSIEFFPETRPVQEHQVVHIQARIAYGDESFDPNAMMDACASLLREAVAQKQSEL